MNPTLSFQKGAVVRLKSGGPPMTVSVLYKESVLCFWFEGKTRKQDEFPFETLIACEPEPS